MSRRHLVAIPRDDGGLELFPMKAWLRQHPEQVPPGLDPSADTSHALRAALRRVGWVVQGSDSEVRLIRPEDRARGADVEEMLDPDTGDSESEAAADGQTFALEYQLRDFIAENLSSIRVGGRLLQLYSDADGRDGVEFPTTVGPIDILAVDAIGDFFVFELKRAQAPDRAVGQLTRYMGWVKHALAGTRSVFGIVVARSIDHRLRYAAKVIPNVLLLEYQVAFRLDSVEPL